VRRIWLLLLVLIGLTAGIYSSVWRFGFVDYDDYEYAYTNDHVHEGLSLHAIGNALTTYRVGNYAPLVSLSYGLDQVLFKLRPGPMHVENVLLHLISGLLLWRLIFITTGKLNWGFAIAALFLVHPMHVESVAWISERKDVLSTPLLLMAMLAYVRYGTSSTPRRRRTAYISLLALFELSLLAKTMGVTLPAVLLLMDVWPLKRWPAVGWKRLVIEKIPLVVLSIIASVVAGFAQVAFNATSSLSELSLTNRINNALVCYVIYIAKLAVPVNLAVFYQHPKTRPWSAVIAAGGLLLFVTYLMLRLRKSRPYLMIGWFWFLGTLVPVIGLVQIGSQAMADRYSYFPSIGLFIAMVFLFGYALHNPMLRAGLLVIILAVFSVAGWQQVSYWRDTRTLFAHAAVAADPNPVAHMQLGNIAYNKGDLNEAFKQYQLAMNPFVNPRALNGMGLCIVDTDPARAIPYYRQAIEQNRNVGAFHANLAAALNKVGRHDEAKTEARIAAKLDPSIPRARTDIANMLHP
jgi:hypothetical protein